MVTEGIFDLLSYLQLKPGMELATDFIVLNSLTNLKGALPKLKSYKRILLMLDNDESGRKTTGSLKELLPSAIDLAHRYKGYNDPNDFLMGSK